MLIIDGIKYKLRVPKNEEEFHLTITENSKAIFGKNSLYLPIEKKLLSKTGRGVMPDGFAIIFSKTSKMYLVEVELSSHDLDKHIVEQINRLGRAIKNPNSRKRIADRLHKEIKNDLMKQAFVKQVIGPEEIYKFLSDLSQNPKILMIIEYKDERVVEACDNLKITPKIIEFKTFVREDAQNVRAHLIESLDTSKEIEHGLKAKITSQQKKISVEQHLNKIKNTKMSEMAIELRHAIRRISDKIEERTTKYCIKFRTSVNFTRIYTQKRGFWLDVKIPTQEFRIPNLNVRPRKDTKWTHIPVDEETHLSLLLEAAKLAYQRTL